ncbi:MAG: hypothetical protein JW953_23195 [Anaerolineae bacterium]|nr:hypothetical protein [Anaerolineae bacterium]
MAKVKLNPVLERIRGQVGDLVFKRYGEEVIISRKPDFEDREWTAAQLTARERFRQATLYGKMVMADAGAKALYEEAAAAKGQPIFSLTIADFLNAPSIDEVDLSGYGGTAGDEIVVRASDDFAVTAVNVSLADTGGAEIESGAAVETPPNSGRWVYPSTAAVAPGTTVRIGVTVTDRPGGVVTATEEKAV